jgi:cytochrome b561
VTKQPETYNLPARALHWLVFLLLAVQYLVVQVMPEGDDGPPVAPAAGSLLDWHMSMGALIGLVVIVRIAWRLTYRAPALPAAMPLWQVRLAKLTHLVLYALLLGLPLAGWAWASARGWTVTLFHVVDLPALVAPGTWPRAFGRLHALMGNLMIAAAGVHVAAALWHHFVARDGVLFTMWPRRA